jgi:hypothetical protein
MSDATPAMSVERFAALAQAYGSGLDRWPEEHRAPAEVIAATQAGHAILMQARSLDLVLDAYRVEQPSAALAGRIVAESGRRRDHRRRILRWWAGLGLVGVSLAGAIAGAMAATAILPRADTDPGMVADTGVWGGNDDVDIEMGRDAL